jgi:hypothetical protein
MLYREITAVCCQIHTKHTNTLCGQDVELLNVKLVVHTVTTGLQRTDINGHIISRSCPIVGQDHLWSYPHRALHSFSYISTSPLMSSCSCTSVDKHDFTDLTGHVFTRHYSELFYWLRLLTAHHKLCAVLLSCFLRTWLVCVDVHVACNLACSVVR